MTKVDTMLKKNKTHLVFLKWPTVFPVPTPVVSVILSERGRQESEKGVPI